MQNEKKVPIWAKIPNWVWVLISLACAALLWFAANSAWPAVFARPSRC